jgi:hypothetical protein
MNFSDRLVGSRSREFIEQFHEACLVSITHGAFAIWLDPFRASSRAAFNGGLASGASWLQLNLEIALSGASAKVKLPNRLLRPARRCVETSGSIIQGVFISTLDSRK